MFPHLVFLIWILSLDLNIKLDCGGFTSGSASFDEDLRVVVTVAVEGDDGN